MSRALQQIIDRLDKIDEKTEKTLITVVQTKTIVDRVCKDVDEHDEKIQELQKHNHIRLGGWQMILIIGSALLSIGALVVTIIQII